MTQDEAGETLGGGAMSRWLGLRKPARTPEPGAEPAAEVEPEPAEPPARLPLDQAALRERGVLLASTQQFAGLARLRLEPPVQLASTALFHSAEIGAFTYLNGGSMYDAVIGRYCSIGQAVRLLPRNHPVDGLSTHPFCYGGLHFLPVGDAFEHARAMRAHQGRLTHAVADKKTTLGHDVWLGDAVTVVNGVTIGTGAVVGACSVVTKDVPPYAIVAGNPARVIRMRFPEPVVEALLASRWWRLAPWDLAKFDLSAPRRAAAAARHAIRKGEAAPYAPDWISLADVRTL